MTKTEILELIGNNRMRIKKNVYKFLKDNDIKIPIESKSTEDIMNYLLEVKESDKFCEICGEKKEFIRVSNKYPNGYPKFCSRKCADIFLSESRKGKNNPCHKMSKKSFDNMRRLNSIIMKKKIRDGEFIPNITNSWANSRCEIEFMRNGKLINQKTRSTWEAFFQLKNPNLLYEKLVIPYNIDGIDKNYIVDFVDHFNKIIYEIKPLNNRNSRLVKIKEEYATKWCVENGYVLIFITDEWFHENYSDSKSIISGQPSEEKLFKNLKQFDEN